MVPVWVVRPMLSQQAIRRGMESHSIDESAAESSLRVQRAFLRGGIPAHAMGRPLLQ